MIATLERADLPSHTIVRVGFAVSGNWIDVRKIVNPSWPLSSLRYALCSSSLPGITPQPEMYSNPSGVEIIQVQAPTLYVG